MKKDFFNFIGEFYSTKKNSSFDMIEVPSSFFEPSKEFCEHIEQGIFCLNGVKYKFDETPFEIENPIPKWEEELLSFEWLGHLSYDKNGELQKLGLLIFYDWVSNYFNPKCKKTWSTLTVSRRLVALLENYRILFSGSDETTLIFTRKIMYYHYENLVNSSFKSNIKNIVTRAKALILFKSCFNVKGISIESEVNNVLTHLSKNLDNDGFVISRDVEEQGHVIREIAAISIHLTNIGFENVEPIDEFIEKMNYAMLVLCHNVDGDYARFSNMQYNSMIKYKKLVKNSNKKNVFSLNETGIYKLKIGKSSIIFDKASNKEGKYFSSTPTAFEFGYGNSIIFRACGLPSHVDDKNYKYMLNSTTGNCLVINNKNIFSLNKNLDKNLFDIKIAKEDNSYIVSMNHDYYKKNLGYKCKRVVYISSNGEKLIGEEEVIRNVKNDEYNDEFEIRFHVDPMIICVLTNCGSSALLQSKNNSSNSWRFKVKNYKLDLEDSICYDGNGNMINTSQLVIRGKINNNETKINWVLKKYK